MLLLWFLQRSEVQCKRHITLSWHACALLCLFIHDWSGKPFHRYFVHFRRRWDSTASIINVFTTFLLLSFSKILFVSLSLFCSSYIHHNFDFPRKCVLYYDTTLECHTQEFIMVAAIASCVLIIFPKILLIVHPTRLFRKCISYFGFRR